MEDKARPIGRRQPYRTFAVNAALTFEDRLKLVCKQILQYKHMYQLNPGVQRRRSRLRKVVS